eukprot:1161363-Pelagomonas_calceolata.AAC.3
MAASHSQPDRLAWFDPKKKSEKERVRPKGPLYAAMCSSNAAQSASCADSKLSCFLMPLLRSGSSMGLRKLPIPSC